MSSALMESTICAALRLISMDRCWAARMPVTMTSWMSSD
jgi:hypothetical protein